MTDALLVELLWDDLTLGEQSMPTVCHCYQEYCDSTTWAYYNYGGDNVRSRNGPLRIYSYSCSHVAVKKKEHKITFRELTQCVYVLFLANNESTYAAGFTCTLDSYLFSIAAFVHLIEIIDLDALILTQNLTECRN